MSIIFSLSFPENFCIQFSRQSFWKTKSEVQLLTTIYSWVSVFIIFDCIIVAPLNCSSGFHYWTFLFCPLHRSLSDCFKHIYGATPLLKISNDFPFHSRQKLTSSQWSKRSCPCFLLWFHLLHPSLLPTLVLLHWHLYFFFHLSRVLLLRILVHAVPFTSHDILLAYSLTFLESFFSEVICSVIHPQWPYEKLLSSFIFITCCPLE